MTSLDPRLVQRFSADLLALLERPPSTTEPLALAVSGGPDSMAMLALAHAALPGRIIAATFDHGLRPEAAGEAAMVAGWCERRGVGHRTLRGRALPAANLQAEARVARYAALRRWAVEGGALALATAHHADDQAETFLMRANRGSGLAGLAGVRARRSGGDDAPAIVRPLLGWRHAELRTIVEAASAPFALDPSNADDRFDRVRMRRFLAGQSLLDPAQLARAAAYLGEAEAEMRAVADLLWRERRRTAADGEARLAVADLPRGLRRRLARLAIDEVRRARDISAPSFSDATNIEPLLDALAAGGAATQGGVMISATGPIWHIRAAPARTRR